MGGYNLIIVFLCKGREKALYLTWMDLTFSVFFFSVSVFLRLNGCWLLAVSCWLLARNTSTPIAPIALIYSDSFDHSC